MFEYPKADLNPSFHLLTKMAYCQLLVLKGRNHYWTYVYVFQGAKPQMEARLG